MVKRAEYFEIQGRSNKKVEVLKSNGKKKRERLTATVRVNRAPEDRRGRKISVDEAITLDERAKSVVADLQQRSHGKSEATVYRITPALPFLWVKREALHPISADKIEKVKKDAVNAAVEKVVVNADKRMHAALANGQFDLQRAGEKKVPAKHRWLAKLLMGGGLSKTEKSLQSRHGYWHMRGLMRRMKAGVTDMYDLEHGALQPVLDKYEHYTSAGSVGGDIRRWVGSGVPVINTVTNAINIINDWTSPETSFRSRVSSTITSLAAEFLPGWALIGGFDAPRMSNAIQSEAYQNDLREFYGLDELFKTSDRASERVRAHQAKLYLKIMDRNPWGIFGFLHPVEKATKNGNGLAETTNEVVRRGKNVLNAANGKTRAERVHAVEPTSDQLAVKAGRTVFEKPQTNLRWAQNVVALAPTMKVNTSLSEAERMQWTQAEDVAKAQIAMYEQAKRITGRR